MFVKYVIGEAPDYFAFCCFFFIQLNGVFMFAICGSDFGQSVLWTCAQIYPIDSLLKRVSIYSCRLVKEKIASEFSSSKLLWINKNSHTVENLLGRFCGGGRHQYVVSS